MPLHRPLIALCLALGAVPQSLAAAEPDAGAYLAARSAVIAADYEDAVTWFTRAIIADPTNIMLLEGALVGQISLGQFDPAITIAEQMKRSGLKTRSEAIVLAAQDAKRGAFEGYLSGLKAGQVVNPAVDALNAAWAELGAGRMSEALAGFDKIAATKGLEAFGLYHKALALAAVGDFENADKILADPKLQVMRRGVIARAQMLSQLEQNDEAIKLLEANFGTGQDPMIDVLIADLKAGKTLPFDVVRNATDGFAEVFFTVAAAMNGQAANSETLVYSRTAAYLRPDHIDAILMSGALLQAQKQYDLAIAAYNTVPADNPAHYAAAIGIAEATEAKGDADQAIKELQALAKDSDLIIVNVSLGDALRRQEKFADAVVAYDKAVSMISEPEPRYWGLYYSRGIANERTKNFDKADADFREALKLNPDQPQVLNYLGYSMVERNLNLDEALAMIQKAVALEPQSGYIVDSLSWALFTLGRYQEALPIQEHASLLEPVEPTVTDHLGDVYWAVGRTREAKYQWQRALSYDPTEEQAKRIQRKLDIGLDAVLKEEGAKPLLAVAPPENPIVLPANEGVSEEEPPTDDGN